MSEILRNQILGMEGVENSGCIEAHITNSFIRQAVCFTSLQIAFSAQLNKYKQDKNETFQRDFITYFLHSEIMLLGQ
jgi:hypothetical protein